MVSDCTAICGQVVWHNHCHSSCQIDDIHSLHFQTAHLIYSLSIQKRIYGRISHINKIILCPASFSTFAWKLKRRKSCEHTHEFILMCDKFQIRSKEHAHKVIQVMNPFYYIIFESIT